MTIVTRETKMTSHDDKKHTVSNWFSSLRRQPKPKKIPNKKHLQKSCLDLTSAATNSTSLPASLTNSPKQRSGCPHSDANHLLTSKSSDVSTQLPTSTNEKTPNQNAEKQNNLTSNVNNLPEMTTNSLKRTNNNGESLNVHSGKTVTTITRKITKITVIKNKEQNFRRAGLIFDDNGKLISESIAYQNFAKNFRSNLIGNVNNGAIQTNDIINACDNENSNDNATSSTAPMPMNDSGAKVDVSSADGIQEQSEHTNCSISDRLITSNSLDDEIEFIDSSSSMSDICSISNCAADDIYFNTLPKLPKSYASIKQQTAIEPKLCAEISIQTKVDTL